MGCGDGNKTGKRMKMRRDATRKDRDRWDMGDGRWGIITLLILLYTPEAPGRLRNHEREEIERRGPPYIYTKTETKPHVGGLRE